MTQDGMYFWSRGHGQQLTAHFHAREFECTCAGACDTNAISHALVDKLERVRKALQCHVVVTSGFRCAAKQQELRAAGAETPKGTSQHELGKAADIQIKSNLFGDSLKELEREFKAIGVARSFYHVDLRDDKKRRWVYK